MRYQQLYDTFWHGPSQTHVRASAFLSDADVEKFVCKYPETALLFTHGAELRERFGVAESEPAATTDGAQSGIKLSEPTGNDADLQALDVESLSEL